MADVAGAEPLFFEWKDHARRGRISITRLEFMILLPVVCILLALRGAIFVNHAIRQN